MTTPGLLYGNDWTWNQRVHLFGEVFAYSRDVTGSKRAEGFGKLRYELGGQNENFFGKLNIRLLTDSAHFTQGFADEPNNNSKRTYFNLDEAFVGARFGQEGQLKVQIGKQIHNWSITDEIHPVNIFAATDYTDPLRKNDMGVLSLSGKYILGENSFVEVLVIPAYFTPSRMAQRRWDPFQGLPRKRRLPASGASSFSGGLRYQTGLGDASLSLVTYYGRDPIPELRSDPTLLSIGQIGIVDSYPRTWMAGLNFTLPWGNLVLKGESAFFLHSGSDDYTHLILGADYKMGDLFLVFQYFHEEVLREVRGGFVDRGFRRIFKDLVTLRAEYVLLDDWTLVFKGGYDWGKEQFVAQPKITCRISDRWRVSLTHEAVGGVKSSYFGAVKNNKRTGLSLEFFF